MTARQKQIRFRRNMKELVRVAIGCLILGLIILGMYWGGFVRPTEADKYYNSEECRVKMEGYYGR